MRNILLTLLVISFIPSFAQQKQNFQLSIQLQPELTLHQNQYSYRSLDKYTKHTFNVGIASELQYNFTDRLFLNFGLGYISRRLNTTVFLDQEKLPPPHYSETQELNNTKYILYRTLQVPVNLGYSFIVNNKFKAFVVGGISANYLLNAYYKVGNTQYDDTYKKGYWQGVGVNAGLGADFHLTKNLLFTNIISYSFVNPVHSDKFLFSQNENEISLPHKYLRISAGVKLPL
jgi:opacity protein-like surface antigen